MLDRFNRSIDYLRISVTDRCDFRCRYCMPENGIQKRKHSEILTVEEISEIASAAIELGIRKIRLTGGEPLVRKGITVLCQNLRSNPYLKELTIEEMYNLTNGRVSFGNANSIIKNVFYLSKSQARARELANVLNYITGNNPKYAEAMDYISKNGFEIEPDAITRHSNRGYQISEAVSLNLKKNEIALVEELKKFTNEELLQIMEKGGLSNTRGIITNVRR